MNSKQKKKSMPKCEWEKGELELMMMLIRATTRALKLMGGAVERFINFGMVYLIPSS